MAATLQKEDFLRMRYPPPPLPGPTPIWDMVRGHGIPVWDMGIHGSDRFQILGKCNG